jgi:V8-like Glu-specific endopeptidase
MAEMTEKSPYETQELDYHRARSSETEKAEGSPVREVLLRELTAPSNLASTPTLESVPGYRKPATGPGSFRTRAIVDAVSGSIPGRAFTEAIVGTDDRVRVPNAGNFPWRAICALRITSRSGQQYVGTGWLISRRTVATAGHCVFMHDDGGWAQEITVIPGLNGSRQPFGRYAARRFRTVDGWIQRQAAGSDYGVIQLEDPVPAEVGFFAFAALDDMTMKGIDANISGYPADRDGASIQYYHARKLVKATEAKLFYDIDTFGGQSGSPIWLDLGSRGRVAVGVHTTGSSRGNSGTRINSEVFASLRGWKNE